MSYDAIFVGGGVIGLSSAREAAKRGMTVGLFDPTPGHGASWVAAGMLASVTEAHYGEEQLVRLLVASANRWPGFALELEMTSGLDVGYLPCGTLVVAVDDSDRRALDELLEYRISLGLNATRLSSDDCRSRVPALSPRIRGGADVPGDHQVDNRKLLGALIHDCKRVGVDIISERVTALDGIDNDHVHGVVTSSGDRFSSGAVVLATGYEINDLYTLARLVRPVKGHALRLSMPRRASRLAAGGIESGHSHPRVPFLASTVRGLVHGRPCYIVSRSDGSVVIGATSEERGFDTSVQVGAVRTLLDDARSLVPAVDELELSECSVGLRPNSADNAPLVGWTPTKGLAMAGGHYRHGILLAPITAESVASLLEGLPVCDEMSAFSPDRSFR